MNPSYLAEWVQIDRPDGKIDEIRQTLATRKRPCIMKLPKEQFDCVPWDLSCNDFLIGLDGVVNSTLFSFFSTLFEILPWENVFHLWVGCFPGSRSIKATSETSGLLGFKTLENSQRTGGKHLSTANYQVKLEKNKNRLLFLTKTLFSTV